MYQVAFLPIARQDMIDIIRYISLELASPDAAEILAVEMIEKAEGLALFPYKNVVHQMIKPLKYEYRKLFVKNYVLFYWIDEERKIVTIARVLYARRDFERLLP